MTVPTAALVACCCAYLLAPAPGESIRRLGDRSWPDSGRSEVVGGAGGRRRGALPGVVLVGLLLGLGATLVGGGLRLAPVAVAGLATAAVARKVHQGWRLRTSRRRRQQAVVRLCDALSAELRAGLSALTAIERSCSEADLAPVASAARLGGDVASALRRCGRLPGAEGLRAVAAGWEVAGSSGAGLAGVLERLALSFRSDDDARAEVEAALGPPRATAKMLAVLPVFGVLLGSSMGADPLRFLLTDPWGLACLSGGAVLAATGVWWVERLATAAEL